VKLEMLNYIYPAFKEDGICNLVGVGILSINHNPLILYDNYRI
jgi:hypothetical protein